MFIYMFVLRCAVPALGYCDNDNSMEFRILLGLVLRIALEKKKNKKNTEHTLHKISNKVKTHTPSVQRPELV
jgi:hypothetical protein